MTRDELARRLHDAANDERNRQMWPAHDLVTRTFDQLQAWEQTVMFVAADAALAVVREAVKEAYEDGLHSDPSMESWQDSDTQRKWKAKP